MAVTSRSKYLAAFVRPSSSERRISCGRVLRCSVQCRRFFFAGSGGEVASGWQLAPISAAISIPTFTVPAGFHFVHLDELLLK
jgi:hypothetical protein